MSTLRNLIPLAFVAALAACSGAEGTNGDGGGAGDGPPPGAPAATQALEVAESLELGHPADADVLRRDWEVEVEFDTSDHAAVVAHYDDWLRSEGFGEPSIDEEGPEEYEATYTDDARNLTVELEIDDEDDDDGVEVDFDLTDRTDYAATEAPPAFTGTSFGTTDGPLAFSFYDRDTIDEIEWDFTVAYDRTTTDEASVFDFFDGELVDLGWTRTDDDGDDDEAEYVQEDVELDLEVDDEDEGIEAEIELDKDRFY